MARKIYVLHHDNESGMKFGISNKEYYIFFYDQWNKINTSSIDEARKIYNKLCFDHKIEEAKRLNQVIF